jgi:hypothetical protein
VPGAETAQLLNHLVDDGEKSGRESKAEYLGGLEVDE